MHEITLKIQEEARKLLQDKTVDVVIGYGQAWDEGVVTPCFVTQESQVGRLIFNEHCSHNLAKYLVGQEGYLTSRFRPENARPRVALVAAPATLRTVVVLIQEHQFRREDLVILAIVNGTPAGIRPDIQMGQIKEDQEEREKVLAEVDRIEKLSLPDRWDWWEQELSKCIRCYACRQVCPFCYCEQCIADENQPQWIGRSPSTQNNTTWNIIRAFHLVGRCTGCGECDRVCPVRIPLRALNSEMAAKLEETFQYVAGTNADTPPVLLGFQVDDPDELIG